MAEILRFGALDMQMCVPADWPDDGVEAFANEQNPCGTSGGWHIRKTGDEALAGDQERVSCSQHRGFVHITLDA